MSGRLTITAIAAGLGIALAGCGSPSGSSSSSSVATTAGTPTRSTATKPGAPSLKVTTTPKFAPATGPVRSGTVKIAYRNIAIAPDTVRVKAGSTIEWTNYDELEHNVTSKGGPQRIASKDFGEGKTFSVTVTKPGVIHYVSTDHPVTMNGTVEVIG